MVITDIRDRVGYIYLNRIEKKNAFNPEMISAMIAALNEFRHQDEVKVVVFASKSDVFCAGADLEYLKQIQQNNFEENLKDSMHVKDLFHHIYTYPKITISMIEGHAIAGGAGIATACDFCFMVPEAKLGYTEVKIGFVPAIVSVFLVKKIGEAKARNLLLTGRLIDGAEAKEMGIASAILSKETIEIETHLYAKNLADTTSLESIRYTKELLLHIHHLDIYTAMNLAAESNARMRETRDFQKGIQAFLSKEKLEW